jgi:hypothetical protein
MWIMMEIKIIIEMLMSFEIKNKLEIVIYMITLGLSCMCKIVTESILDWKIIVWKLKTKCELEYLVLEKNMKIKDKIEYK